MNSAQGNQILSTNGARFCPSTATAIVAFGPPATVRHTSVFEISSSRTPGLIPTPQAMNVAYRFGIFSS